MIILPKVRGFICTTAHPSGCEANIKRQIAYVKQFAYQKTAVPLRVLIIGASTGYGLASRIVANFGYGAKTIGVLFERSALAEKTASAGWYNTVNLELQANTAGLYAKSINGDAFTDQIKQQTIELINQDLGGIDLVVYSLAAPRRTTADGISYNSVLKPIGEVYSSKTVDLHTGKVSEVNILPATAEEITATIKVMGGEDLKAWVDYLHVNKLLAPACKVIAYSYIGPDITYPVYRNGTIGAAKDHLEQIVKQINEFLSAHYAGEALVSVNKALVTQASAAIPVVPLYISALYKVMKAKNIHEGCIEQITRLFKDHLYPKTKHTRLLDHVGRIRIDDLEMRTDVQAEISRLWQEITSDNVLELTDLMGYREEFYKLFGFSLAEVDYSKDYNIDLAIPSMVEYAGVL